MADFNKEYSTCCFKYCSGDCDTCSTPPANDLGDEEILLEANTSIIYS